MLLAALFLCLCLGATTWRVAACDRDDYLNRVQPSWIHANERWLFACGRVWRSDDAGQTWVRVPGSGLPLLARDGWIAADRQPGHLYLALIRGGQSRPGCPLCALTEIRPTLFVTDDGGAHWRPVYDFRAVRVGQAEFRALHAHPDLDHAAWVILTLNDETAYYATNNGGEHWRKTCVQFFGYECDPPDEYMQQGQ
jgi:photosystem II stability/assembly factor-like uncharacterized protein